MPGLTGHLPPPPPAYRASTPVGRGFTTKRADFATKKYTLENGGVFLRHANSRQCSADHRSSFRHRQINGKESTGERRRGAGSVGHQRGRRPRDGRRILQPRTRIRIPRRHLIPRIHRRSIRRHQESLRADRYTDQLRRHHHQQPPLRRADRRRHHPHDRHQHQRCDVRQPAVPEG